MVAEDMNRRMALLCHLSQFPLPGGSEGLHGRGKDRKVSFIRQKSSQFLDKLIKIFQFTFPDDQHFPTQIEQALKMLAITHHVPIELFVPVFGIAAGARRVLASRMLVPETAVHKYNFTMSGQDNIGFARQILDVQTKAIPHAVDQRTDDLFRVGILSADLCHHPAAFFGCEDIRHGCSPRMLGQ